MEHISGGEVDDQRVLGALEELNAIAITEILDHDPRPTFIIDLDPDLDTVINPDELSPIFCNASLRLYERLLDAIAGEEPIDAFEGPETSYADFRSWAKSVTKHDDSKDIFPLSFLYSGMLWTGSTVRKRWRLISGNKCYQTSSVTSGDLSSGPPSEVATGGVKANLKSAGHRSSRVVRQEKSTSSPERTSLVLSSETKISKDETKSTPISSDSQRMLTGSDPQDSTWSLVYTKSTPSVIMSTPQNGISDWTLQPLELLPSHIAFARSIDWGSTPLGPIETWSREFRQIVNLLMADPHPAALFYGDDMTVMYNSTYRDIVAGRKHPELMGTGFRGPFSEIWDDVGPIFKECARTGKAVAMANQMLPIERHGFMEETYFSWSCVPLFGGTPKVQGFYNAPFETTQQQVGNRRMQTLRKLGEKVAEARTVKNFWSKVLEGLDDNHFDVPFALLYSVGDADDGEFSSNSSSGSSMVMKCCVFEGGLGIPEAHPAAPPQLDLKRSREGFIPSFREAMRTREPTKLQTRDGSLPESLMEGIEWRGFGEPCREAVIFPVRPTTGENVLGFLLIGVNPRRPYDDEYISFTAMLNRLLATSLASIILFEEEIRRGKTAAEAAAMEQEHLTEQLAVQTSRLQRMTELSPVGLFYIDPDGLLLEANECWFEMTGHPRENYHEYSWYEVIKEEDRPIVADAWHKITVEGVPWSAEVRLKRLWIDPVTGESLDQWILGSAHPEFGSDGNLRSIMGSVTAISHIKWAEGLQNRRLQEAEETRRQQNEFIDITSHEMRNPLSAILQCADDIASSLLEYKIKGSKKAAIPAAVVENCIDAANTIVLCAQHQKCIVDDILTISKLDSNLLLITPVVVQPVAVARRAVKMFDAEFQKKDIQVQFIVLDSVRELDVDWVVLDPSRLLQVLINLLTNAIKFTQSQGKRSITVRVAASLTPPSEGKLSFEYIPPKSGKTNPAVFGEEWGSGELMYLQFEIEDTGRGLTVDEKKLLFMRFSQASPRTHAQYGGSGLGLFISRQLTELHGGQIGVGSEAGVGSTFAFYIKAKRPTITNTALIAV
jgi:signal transduction histidine kinase